MGCPAGIDSSAGTACHISATLATTSSECSLSSMAALVTSVGRFRDMNRDNRFALIEWITLRYGWYDVSYRPCLVAFQIASALVTRGWNGVPTRCPGCLHVPETELLG